MITPHLFLLTIKTYSELHQANTMSTINIVFATEKHAVEQSVHQTIAQVIMSYVVDEKRSLHTELKQAHEKMMFGKTDYIKTIYYTVVDNVVTKTKFPKYMN